MLNAPRQLDHNGGQPVLTENGPAVLYPLAWLMPGQLAALCADRVIKRIGCGAQSGQVMQEAVKLTGKCPFCQTTAKKALRDLHKKPHYTHS